MPLEGNKFPFVLADPSSWQFPSLSPTRVCNLCRLFPLPRPASCVLRPAPVCLHVCCGYVKSHRKNVQVQMLLLCVYVAVCCCVWECVFGPKPISPACLTWVFRGRCGVVGARNPFAIQFIDADHINIYFYVQLPASLLQLPAACRLPLWHHAVASLLFLCPRLKSIPPINKPAILHPASFPISESGFWAATVSVRVCVCVCHQTIKGHSVWNEVGEEPVCCNTNWAKSLTMLQH